MSFKPVSTFIQANKAQSECTEKVSQGVWWGKQTQSSLLHFNIGKQCFDHDFIHALVAIKLLCADVNYAEGLLNKTQHHAILYACKLIIKGHYEDQFPLRIWQTGSGTQTNMNVNEVIASLANAYLRDQVKTFELLTKDKIHPNDHVNMSQSSNDVFPSAMHVVVAQQSTRKLLPSLNKLCQYLQEKQSEFKGVSCVGRTHLMDAIPLPAGAILSVYLSELNHAKLDLQASLQQVFKLALGGTAVGSGANSPPNFGRQVIAGLAKRFELPFEQHENLYTAVSGESALLKFSASLKLLASVLLKMANDFRLLGSGPRCGLNEWILPANEPGSSIMPGKVNPTQCEALSMVCMQVFGNDLTVSLAASAGQLQLNTSRPVIIHNIMESIELLSDAIQSFAENCLYGLTLNKAQIEQNMTNNLSIITLLTPELGYDMAASIVKEAQKKHLSLAQSAESLGLFSRTDFEDLLKRNAFQ
ncbi:class II fumarate hydratase [Alteromonas arenosi]|nr:class II fumarate hydratase [Alteromonas sp. ASW11-36]